MSRTAGCEFRVAQALKIAATKVRTETLAKQMVVSRKAKLRGIRRRSGAENSCDESFGRNFGKTSDGVEEGRLAGCRRSSLRARATTSSTRNTADAISIWHDPEATGASAAPLALSERSLPLNI